MKHILLSLALILNLTLFAGTVDSLSIYSPAMKRSYKAVVIKPTVYNFGKGRFPVVYLLHGLGGAYNNWITKVPQLKRLVDEYNLIVVCPDGAVSSWYFDSPVDSTMRFETYIATELPQVIDKKYRTIQDRSGRAITGLSMGGHGGLFLGFRHTDAFGACGSMSGALAIEYIKSPNYAVSKRLGDTTNTERYREYSIMKQMEKPIKDTQAIIIDCGTEDFIIEMSRAAHKRMLELKIGHDYTERPGGHNWNYWANAVQYQLLFFRNYFNRALSNTNQK